MSTYLCCKGCWLLWTADDERVCSDYSGTNVKLPKILLNGNNICMVRRCISADFLGGRTDLQAAHTRRRRPSSSDLVTMFYGMIRFK